MPSYSDPPFSAGAIISDSRYFVGYEAQLDKITNRAIAAQPTSINIVGDKRIGKSSLLYHFCQTYEERIESRGENPRNFLAVYLSLQQGNCKLKSGFYQVVAEELSKNLDKRYEWYNKPKKLLQALKATSFDTASFYRAMMLFREVGILPIICLDKIEALFQHPEEFNKDFYDNLRSLMDSNALMLVITSRKSIRVYSERNKLNSDFFNVGQSINLKGFTDKEAKDLVRLPESNISSLPAALEQKEQQIALEWGGKNPYLLQLAGLCLWEAKERNKDINWARKRFNNEAKGIETYHRIWRKCWFILKWLLWNLPVRLGKIGRFLGANLGDIGDGVVGWCLMIIFFFVLFQKVPPESIIDAVKSIVLGD